MPINMKWIIPGRVGYSELYGRVDIKEIKKFNDFMLEGLTVSNSNELFHIISDSRHHEIEVSQIPDVLKSMLTDDYSPLRKHPNMGWSLVISDSKVTHFISSIIAQKTKNRLRIMPDLKSSLEFLKEQDQNLDWESVNIDEITS